jgi:hypothetical protein
VFGLVRTGARELSSEESLEEYHLFLDQKAEAGPEAAAVYVIFPEPLLAQFTGILTHEIHREYWHRIIPVPSREGNQREAPPDTPTRITSS